MTLFSVPKHLYTIFPFQCSDFGSRSPFILHSAVSRFAMGLKCQIMPTMLHVFDLAYEHRKKTKKDEECKRIRGSRGRVCVCVCG